MEKLRLELQLSRCEAAAHRPDLPDHHEAEEAGLYSMVAVAAVLLLVEVARVLWHVCRKDEAFPLDRYA